MAAPPGGDWFEREELIGQISDIRVQNLQVERELVQKRTFTRWMNLHLQKCDPPIEVHDLFQDIQDGRILMALLEELSGCRLLHGFKKSSHRIFRLNNIAKVLSFLEERNVKLVSIDAANVADGNSSIVLGLIWNIILFFQIKELTGNIRSQFPSCSSLSSLPTSSDSDASICSTPSDERPSAATVMREHSKAIKKLLQWVQKRTRKYGVTVHDFGQSWKSGLPFLAVIKSIDPTLVDMSKAFLRSARENLDDAFHIAHYSLGIPRLLDPEDLTISSPDEQSIITYVSQFLEHFPGVEETEERQQPIERSTSIGRLNFSDGPSDPLKHEPHGSADRSYRFQKECRTKYPPKILISSQSEDKSIRSSNFRVAPKRTWSSENISSRYSTCDFSRKPENVISGVERSPVDSSEGFPSIASTESWDQGEPRATALSCDSGTGWDIYRAIPVEVTSVDEGFISPMDGAPEELSMTESFTDVGIYSLSSLESSPEGIQAAEELTDSVSDPLHHEAVLTPRSVSDHNQTETREAPDPLQYDVTLVEITSEVLKEGEEPEPEEDPLTHEFPQDEGEWVELKEKVCEEATETTTVEEAEGKRGADPAQGTELEWKHSDLSSETTEELQSETFNDFSKPPPAPDSWSEVCRVGETPDRNDLEGPTRTFLDVSIPLISISTASQELQDEGMSDSEDSCTARRAGVDQGYRPDEEESSSSADRNPHPDGSSCLESEEVKENLCGEDSRWTETPEQNTQEWISDILDSEGEPRDSIPPSTQTETQLWSTDVTDQPHRHHSLSSEGPITEQDAPQVFTSRPHEDVIPPCEPSGSISGYRPDQQNGSPPEGVRASPMEPMDLFYPDSEELLFTESRDTEMLSWPSVLSVSALLPAPASPADQLQPFVLPEDASEEEWRPLHHTKQVGCQSHDRSESLQQNDDSPVPATEAVGTPSGTDVSPPVLRLRKGGGSLTEPRDTRVVESKPAPTSDSELRCVLRALLLLWLLLYCWWILPQIDVKTLPDLLFNLQH